MNYFFPWTEESEISRGLQGTKISGGSKKDKEEDPYEKGKRTDSIKGK